MNENVTIQIFRKLANQLATVWKDYIRPMPFEATFDVGGVDVVIKVREKEPNTQPVWGADKDDWIAD